MFKPLLTTRVVIQFPQAFMNIKKSTISNDKAGARLNYGVHHTNEAKKRMKFFSPVCFTYDLYWH